MATFTLMDGIDIIAGTSAADRFEGGTNALQTGDIINGGGGQDELVAGVIGTAGQAPRIANVETLFLDTAGLPFDIANISGANRIVADGASIILEPIETADLSTRFGARNVESGTVKLQFADGALGGERDGLLLGTNGSNVTFTSDSTFDSTMDGEANATEDRLRIERINLEVAGDNQVDISDFSAIETLSVRGEGSVKISIDAPTLETLNAQSFTGDLTVTNDIAGDQVIIGGTGIDDVKTGSGDDTLRTFAGDDVVNAGGGDNVVLTDDGDDEVITEAGADTIVTGAGMDMVDSGSGEDVIVTGDGDDTILAGDGADLIRSGDGADDVRAGGGRDRISDGAGDDIVRGGGDNDVFLAGTGNDEFIGGGGSDTFVFTDAAFGNDTVSDFALTSNGSTNDVLSISIGGTQEVLRSQGEFRDLDQRNDAALSFDANTDTVTINGDGGMVTLQVSDADFLLP